MCVASIASPLFVLIVKTNHVLFNNITVYRLYDNTLKRDPKDTRGTFTLMTVQWLKEKRQAKLDHIYLVVLRNLSEYFFPNLTLCGWGKFENILFLSSALPKKKTLT